MALEQLEAEEAEGATVKESMVGKASRKRAKNRKGTASGEDILLKKLVTGTQAQPLFSPENGLCFKLGKRWSLLPVGLS